MTTRQSESDERFEAAHVKRARADIEVSVQGLRQRREPSAFAVEYVPRHAENARAYQAREDRRIDDERAGRPTKPFAEMDGRDRVGAAFRRVRDALGLPGTLTFHRAGRHSFASRLLSAGAALDEVSQALGHADVRLTQRTYVHFVRKTFSAALVAPMQVGAKVIPIGARATTAPAAETTKEAAHG
jgi:integrase